MSADERTLGERVEAVRLALSTDLFQDGLLRAMVSQEAAALLLEQQAEIERLTANDADREALMRKLAHLDSLLAACERRTDA